MARDDGSLDHSCLLMVLVAKTFPHCSAPCAGRGWGAEGSCGQLRSCHKKMGERKASVGLRGKEEIPSASSGVRGP